jgi:riboflavin kinase/FMN adenylyltransferase
MPDARPQYGVYIVYLRREGAETAIPGVANYGLRPTMGASADPVLEVHLLAPADLPSTGDHVRVALLDFLRPEETFPDAQVLREQIGKDVETVRGKLGQGAAFEPPVF